MLCGCFFTLRSWQTSANIKAWQDVCKCWFRCSSVCIMRVLCANLHGISNTVALLSHFSVVYNCLDISRIYTGDECVLRRESGPWSAFRHAVTWAEQRFPQIKTNKRGILARRRKIILHLSCYQKEPLAPEVCARECHNMKYWVRTEYEWIM